jgi:hypothetical protein
MSVNLFQVFDFFIGFRRIAEHSHFSNVARNLKTSTTSPFVSCPSNHAARQQRRHWVVALPLPNQGLRIIRWRAAR